MSKRNKTTIHSEAKVSKRAVREMSHQIIALIDACHRANLDSACTLAAIDALKDGVQV